MFQRRIGMALSMLVVLILANFSTSIELGLAAAPATCTTVQYGAFFKDAAYLIAEKEGFFTQEGLCVNYNQVKGSVPLFNDLMAGNYHIIGTSLDNVANRIVNQNLPLSMIAGSDKGKDFVLAVNNARGIYTVADLKGKAIAVDAPDSGFVLALRKILASNGLYLEKGDYSFQLVGGTSLRYQYLQAGQTPTGEPVYASMLVYPYTARITGQVSIAARLSDYLTPYQINGLAITTAYGNNNRPTINAFLRAYIKAGYFLFDPANHDKVVADIIAGYGVSQTVAEAELLAALSGQNVGAKIDKKGMLNVIKLRQEFNGFVNPVDPKKFIKPAKGGFYDDSFWKAAYHSVNEENDNENDDNEGED